MKITKEISISEFEAWSGAEDTLQVIIDNNKESEFDALIEEMYPDGLTETQLNDILWFEEEWVFESLGISGDNEAEDDEDEHQE